MLLPFFEFRLHALECLGVIRMVGEVDDLMRITIEIVELVLRAVQVGVDGALAVVAILSLPDALPGG